MATACLITNSVSSLSQDHRITQHPDAGQFGTFQGENLRWRIGFPVVVDRRCFRLGYLR
jgi:hypothetical protein